MLQQRSTAYRTAAERARWPFRTEAGCQVCTPPVEKGGLAQLARAPALQAGGQRFESVILHQQKEDIDILEATVCMALKPYELKKLRTSKSKRAIGQPKGVRPTKKNLETVLKGDIIRKGEKGT